MIQRIFSVSPGTVLLNQLIPKSVGGGTWQHAVDIFVPNVYTRAYISLHGGGGTKGYHEVTHRVRMTNSPTPSRSQINWALLNKFRTIAVYPQGQSCTTANATGNPFNPNGVNTVSADFPYGVLTWSNDFHWSGQNDKQFLLDLRLYLLSTFPAATKIHLNGTSSGGIMTMKMHREEPVFDSYSTIVGPLVALQSVPYTYSTVKPLFQIFGRKDSTLGIYNGSAGTGDHWFDPFWYQQSAGLTRASVAGAMVGGQWIPALTTFRPPGTFYLQDIIAARNTQEGDPAETYNYAAGEIHDVPAPGIGQYHDWQYCGGKVAMRLYSEAGHDAKSYLTTVKDNIIKFQLAWMVTAED